VCAECNKFPIKRGLFGQSQKYFLRDRTAALWGLVREALVNDQIEVAESAFSVQKRAGNRCPPVDSTRSTRVEVQLTQG
jgi:hypothetical protein